MRKRPADHEEIVYQCHTCHFVLIRKRGDPPPSYCPNCAINHLKGEMIPVWEACTSRTERNEYTKR